MLRYYFFTVKTGGRGKPKERFLVVPAQDDTEAGRNLFKKLSGGEPFSAKEIGWATKDDLFSWIIPKAKLDNPISVISAVQYVEGEYAHLMSPTDKRVMRGVRRKLIKDFFG